MRTYARETAFSMVYAYMMNNSLEEGVTDMFDAAKLDEVRDAGAVYDTGDREFAYKLYSETVGDLDRLISVIEGYSLRYRAERIYRVDMALLVTAVCEIEKFGTPAGVVINSVVDLARKFSTGDSVKFVNGVLGAYARRDKEAQQPKDKESQPKDKESQPTNDKEAQPTNDKEAQPTQD